MEIGNAVICPVEKHHRPRHKRKQCGIALLLHDDSREQLRDKQRHGILDRIGMEAVQRMQTARLLYTIQVAPMPDVGNNLNKRERLKQRPALTRHLAVALRQQKRHDAMHVGVDTHNSILVVVFYGAQHHPLQFLNHCKMNKFHAKGAHYAIYNFLKSIKIAVLYARYLVDK